MPNLPDACIVRLLDTDGNAVGAGFLVGPKLIVTCAHVVCDALRLDRFVSKPPLDEVQMDFPCTASKQLFQARVVLWKPDANSSDGDVAGLELTCDPPPDSRPVELLPAVDVEGNRFKALGFPDGFDGGVWARGVMRNDHTAKNWIQIEDVKTQGQRIQQGFSGSPVWNRTQKGVVGMVVASDKDPQTKTAFAIPTESLVRAWPAIQVAKASPSTDDPAAPHSRGRSSNAATGSRLPPLPRVFVGRDDDLLELKKRLGIGVAARAPEGQLVTAVHGLPGVGKSTLAAQLAYDGQTHEAFQDGVLWLDFGQFQDANEKEELLSRFESLGIVLGRSLKDVKNLRDAQYVLNALLRDQRRLLILDDVWKADHAENFRLGGPQCATLLTTRDHAIADALANSPYYVLHLRVLSPEASLDLLRRLAPRVAENNEAGCATLAETLGYLPLALTVAGGLLREEPDYSVSRLMDELQQGRHILEAKAPSQLTALEKQAPTPTVAEVLKKSVDVLPPDIQDCFAWLSGVPSNGVFDLNFLKAQWRLSDYRRVAHLLVNRGLLEWDEKRNQFRMHPLLILLAASLTSE
jgi:hypothetical protein